MVWENSWSHRFWEVSLWSLCLQLGQTKGLRACPAPGKVAHYTTWWERDCTLPVQAAPRTAGILLTAEPSLTVLGIADASSLFPSLKQPFSK